MSDAEKREKLIVIKKLEGLEKELKVRLLSSAILKLTKTNISNSQLLAYSESLTDQVGKYLDCQPRQAAQ